MRKMKIVSDSSCDLLALKNAEFANAPMKIITDEQQFVDDAVLDVEGMVNYFDHYKGKSKTSCPNIGDWLEAFGDADDVFCVTITSGLSGSYNSACAAKKMYEEAHEGKRVFVVDTLSAGPEVTLVVEKLEEYIRDGLEYTEICEKIQQYQQNTGLIFMLQSLKNFANNGRVSPAVAKIAGMMGICIVGKASDQGTLEPTHKCRGVARSLDTMIEDLTGFGLCAGKVSIGYSSSEDTALRLKAQIEFKFPQAQVEIHPLRGLCSFYAEKGGILVGFEKK